MEQRAWERVPIDAQSVEAPLSRAAVFLVMEAGEGDAALAGVRDVLGAVGDLVKNVGFRDLDGRLSCVVGIGSALWDRLSPGRRPADLRPFAPIRGPVHAAPSTPGDLLFHIRAEREDMTFELERQLLDVIGDAARVVDETLGFRYFDARDLLGFVDGTANPTGAELPDAALIGADADPDVRRRQLRRRAEVPARHGRLGRAADRGAGGDHRPHQDRQHRDRRRRRAAQVAQDAGDDRGPTPAASSRSCATTCRSAAPARASSAPTSSATPAGSG